MKKNRFFKVLFLNFVILFTLFSPSIPDLFFSLGAPGTIYAQDSIHQNTNLRWNHDLMNIEEAWTDGYTGEGVTIAILDTGFYHRHPDIEMMGGYSVFSDDAWSNDHSGHGTHIAGIIGANQDSNYPGIAPGANIYGIKIYHEDDMDVQGYVSTTVDSLIKGVRQAINIEADILVISSGLTFHDQGLHDIIVEGYNAGMLIIAASGNGNASVNYPASYEEVIAVTAIDEKMEPALDIIYGNENDFTAPGVNIGGLSIPESAYSFPYIFMSGSSQATPHVAGLAAIIMQKHNVRGQEARNWMRRYAMSLGDENLYGHGLLQYASDPNDTDIAEDVPEGNDETESEEGVQPTSEDNGEGESIEEVGSVRKPDSSRASDPDDPDIGDTAEYYQTDPIEQDGRQVLGYDVLPIVESGGTLEITLNDYTSVYLTEDQIKEIRERNIRLALSKTNVSWYILPGNFLSGEAHLRFYEGMPVGIVGQTGAVSTLYTISIYQAGVRQNSHPTWMELRFDIDDLPGTNFRQYEGYRYDKVKKEWSQTLTEVSNEQIILRTRHTSSLGIFDPENMNEPAPKEQDIAEKEEVERPNYSFELFLNPFFIGAVSLILLLIIAHFVKHKRKH